MPGQSADRQLVPDIIITISDAGTPSSSQQDLQVQIDALRAGTYIIPVAISAGADTSELLSIATDQTGSFRLQTISQFRYVVLFSDLNET